MELGECYTSIPPQANRQRGNAFDEVTPYASSTSPAGMKKGPCDVFINHRGCDTKKTLASTIYRTLRMNNIHAFLDEEELELGDSIPVEIEKAMRTAGVHIAIFSKRYAESAWCLAELSYMLQTGTPIIPVFYHVDPSDLRRVAQGKGCYAAAFSQHEKKDRYSNMLEDWKKALQRVSNISGYMLNINIGDEMMPLKSIVNSVLRKLRKEPLEVAKHPVGMDEIVQDFEKSLVQFAENEEGVQIVGIAGLGGSGKTTLATEIYNKKSCSIHRSSFLHDVRDAASRNGLHIKQKKLLGDVRIDTKSFENLDNVKDGKEIIADRLRNLCVLIVLDDVDHEDQIDALLPPKESLGRGSLVIITTRDLEVLTKWGITFIYKIKPLQDLHAKQLFCWHAFLHPSPLQGFEDLVQNFLNSCRGLPLSLKVIGGQLYGKSSKDYWVSQLNKIQRLLPSDILKRLKVSYDALDEEEQEVFLDIACLLIDKRRSMAIDVWDASGWSGLCSWEALQNKCLVESYEGYYGEERIRMHDHLRDLGRQIAKTHSSKRIRIEGTPFRGILGSEDRRVKYEFLWGANESREKCAELLRGVLWLEWREFKESSFPSWLPLDTITCLEFSRSEFLETLWEDSREDSHLPLQLRELQIGYAPRLQSLPRSIGRLRHLKILSLHSASRLPILPEEFCELQLLEHLVLKDCDGLSSLPNRFGDLMNLQHLDLSSCHGLLCLPNRFGDLMNLQHLDLSFCETLKRLPESFGDLMNLQNLDLSYCKTLKRLPESFKQLIHLKYLNLDGCVSLESLDNIPNLNVIHFTHPKEIPDHTYPGQLSLVFSRRYICKLLSIICQLICQLSEVKLSELKELQIVHSYTNSSEILQMSSLQNLTIEECELYENLILAGLVSLTNLEVRDCEELQKIEISQMPCLQKLTIKRCSGLHEISNLARLVSLTTLEVEDCEKLEEIKGLECLTLLEKLALFGQWRDGVSYSLRGLERLQTLKLSSENISSFGDCILRIEMENWPRKMTICALQRICDPEPILDSFTFPGVDDVHRMIPGGVDFFGGREWSLTGHETNLSNAALVCFLVQCHSKSPYRRVCIRKVKDTRVTLLSKGRWIVMWVFKEVSCLVEDGGGGLLSLNVGVVDGPAEVLGGWVMVGERSSILYAFKQLFQSFY